MYLDVFAACAVAIVVVMVATWMVSLLTEDVSIIDPVWGLGFVVVAWVARLAADGHGVPIRQNVLVGLTTIWGLRLFVHLLVRHHGGGEDFRYRAMRKKQGERFRFTSLYRVFAFQGLMMFVVSMPVQGDMLNGHQTCHGGYLFTLADSAFAYACNSHNQNTVASACHIDFLAPAKECDVLEAEAIERSLAGRTGVYDVTVRVQGGQTIALFRGKSYRISGEVINGLQPTEQTQ